MALNRRIVFHFATGGIAHFLRLLENSVQWANRWGFRVAVVSEPAKTLAFRPFEHYFEWAPSAPILPLGQLPYELLVRPNGVHVNDYRADWSGDPCVLRSGADQETPRSVTFLNRFGTSPQLTFGNQRRFFHETYSYLLPQLSLTHLIAGPVADAVRFLDKEDSLGVHFRNTDRPGDLQETLVRVANILAEKKVSKVLWCSDDPYSVEQARAEFPDIEIIEGSTKPPTRPGAENLHYGVADPDTGWMLCSTFVDLALLSSTQYFLPCPPSAWASLVPFFRANPKVRDSFFRLRG